MGESVKKRSGKNRVYINEDILACPKIKNMDDQPLKFF